MRILLLTTAAVLAGSSAFAEEIRVLNWQGYGTDIDWALAAYTETTGNTVVHEYFTSEQEMMTMLRTNPGAYDVELVISAFTAQMQAESLLAPIDASKSPNFKDIDPAFASNEDLNAGGALHGVPWTWGLTSFAVNTGEFAMPPTSNSVLWDPAYKGRISIRDDGLEAVPLAALATAQNINAIADLDTVKAKLTELMPQISTYCGSENDWNQYIAAGDLGTASYWLGSAARAIGKGLPVAFVVPDEGAFGWLDGLSVPATSTKQDAAYSFIDWMIDPDFFVKWDTEGASATSNMAAAAAFPATRSNRSVPWDSAVVAKVPFMKPVSDDDRAKYLALWQELKAAQ